MCCWQAYSFTLQIALKGIRVGVTNYVIVLIYMA